MEVMNEIFPWDALYPQAVEQSTCRGLDTIPTEILDSIVSYIPHRTLSNLALVDSRCRAVATRYIYHSVTINGNLFSIKPKDPEKKLPEPDAPIPEILEAGNIKACRLLKRLLSNDQHIAAIHEFQIKGYPLWADRPYFIAFIQHIWQNATNLMRIDHQYFPSKPTPLPNPCWSDSLRHIRARHVCWWGLKALESTTMRQLTLTACTQTTRKLFNQDLRHITHFEYLWHDWKEDNLETSNFDWIPEVFPNLRTLKIGVCECWVDPGISHEIYLATLCKLVSNLPQLETFIIGKKEENAISEEETCVNDLENAQPALHQVTFQWRESRQSQVKEVTWRRYGSSLMTQRGLARKLYPREVRWTPDPTLADRLHWWFTAFGIPCISRPEMLRRWNHQADGILSEQALSVHVLHLIRAELSKEIKCYRESRGICDCVLCKF